MSRRALTARQVDFIGYLVLAVISLVGYIVLMCLGRDWPATAMWVLFWGFIIATARSA